MESKSNDSFWLFMCIGLVVLCNLTPTLIFLQMKNIVLVAFVVLLMVALFVSSHEAFLRGSCVL